MNRHQPVYLEPQNLPNLDQPMVDPSEIQNTANFQNHSSQQRSQRGRSSLRMPPHLASHQTKQNGSVNGGTSIRDPISLSSPSPDRSPQKRAASRAPIDNRSPKRLYRAGSVYGQSTAHKTKIEYQNQINFRDAHMHGPGSPLRHQIGAPRTPVSAETQSRLDELQRKKDNLIAQTMAAHKEQFSSILVEEQQLKIQNSGSPKNSAVNGSPNGMAPSPTRNGFKTPLGHQISPRSTNGLVNVFEHYPQGAYNIQNSSLPPQSQLHGFPQNSQSPAQSILQPAIWDSGASSSLKKNFVDSIRERAWRDKENNIPNRSAARNRGVAPPSQRSLAYNRGKSVGATIYRRVEGDSRLVNMQTGQWASSSEEDVPVPPPQTAGRSQRGQTVGPNGASHGESNIGVGIPVEGIHSRNFQPRSRTVAPSEPSQVNFVNDKNAQDEESNRFQGSRTVVREPVTPQRMGGTENGQQSSFNNFVTPPEFPQSPRSTFNVFNNSPNGKSLKAEPVTPQNKAEIPYPTSESGSLLEHLHRARLRARGTDEQPQQYKNDIPKGGIAFRARKKEPVTPVQRHLQHDIINLISPDGSETRHPLLIEPFPEPPIIEKPMKDRIAPASKSGARKRAKSVAPEAPVDPIAEERKRQERAATIILEKERKATEGSIFGDDPVEEESRKAEQRKRLAQRREERLLAAAQEKESRELEQRKLQAAQQAKAEETARQKELQEAKNRVRREVERKAAEAQEAKGREERREVATARIEAERKKKEEAKLEVEKKRQKDNEIQVKTKLLEEQKAKQENLKKQLSGIHASKISSDDSSIVFLGNNNKVQAESQDSENEVTNDQEQSATNGTTTKQIIDFESALFVPANVPPSHDGTEAVTINTPQKVKQPLLFDQSGSKDMYGFDMRALRGKSKGPTTAAELMALAQAKNAGGNARDIREREMDARRAAAAAERLMSRMARREREKSAPPPVHPRRSEPKAARASAFQPEPKQAKQPAKPRAAKGVGKSTEKNGTSALFPTYIAENYAEPPPPNNKVTAIIPKEPAGLSIAKPGLVLLSDEERVRLEAEQKKKEALELEKRAIAKALEKEERARAYNEKNRQKATEKAREKHKAKLIEEAEKNGVELTQVELMSKLEDFMEKREGRKAATARTRALKDSNKNFGQDNLANLNKNAAQVNNDEDAEDSEDDSPEALERKAQIRSVRETLNAMSQGRRSQLSQTVRMTCADESDCDSSDASEEDSDTPTSSDSESEDYEDGSTSQSHGSRNRSRKSGSRPSADDLGTQIEEVPTLAKKFRRALPRPQFAEDPENCVRMYTIMECMTKNGVQQRPYTRQSYLNHDEALKAVQDMAERYRKNKPSNACENWDDNLYEATFFMDKEGDNMLDLWLGMDFKSKDMNPADFHMNEIKKLRFLEKTYFVKRTIVTRKTNPETGVEREVVDPQHLSHWSDIELANNNAMDLFVKYTKPPRPILDHLEFHANTVCPQLRKARQDLGYGDCFGVTVDREDGLEWLPEEIVSVSFEVDLRKTKGPLN